MLGHRIVEPVMSEASLASPVWALLSREMWFGGHLGHCVNA